MSNNTYNDEDKELFSIFEERDNKKQEAETKARQQEREAEIFAAIESNLPESIRKANNYANLKAGIPASKEERKKAEQAYLKSIGETKISITGKKITTYLKKHFKDLIYLLIFLIALQLGIAYIHKQPGYLNEQDMKKISTEFKRITKEQGIATVETKEDQATLDVPAHEFADMINLKPEDHMRIFILEHCLTYQSYSEILNALGYVDEQHYLNTQGIWDDNNQSLGSQWKEKYQPELDKMLETIRNNPNSEETKRLMTQYPELKLLSEHPEAYLAAASLSFAKTEGRSL